MVTKRFIFSFLLVCLASTGARAACDPFPESRFFGAFTHDQVRSYVDRQLGGDWTRYLGALRSNLERLRDLQLKGDGAILKVRGEPVKLSSSDLTRFVYASKQWYEVALCLSRDIRMAEAQPSLEDLGNFSTAAGGITRAPAGSSQVTHVKSATPESFSTNNVTFDNEVANLSYTRLSVQITTTCVAGDTIFTVTNTGDAWPKTGKFSLFRINGPNRQVIGARRMRLDVGESKNLTVSSSQNQTGHVGLAITPSWYERKMDIDADARCK